MTSQPKATIKVPKHLRERLSLHAGHAGLTVAALISEMLDERERQARFGAVRRPTTLPLMTPMQPRRRNGFRWRATAWLHERAMPAELLYGSASPDAGHEQID